MKLLHNRLYINVLFGLVLILSTSCSKYDEGGISIRAEEKISKKSWFIENSQDVIYFKEMYSFQKDGHFERTTLVGINSYILYGKWELVNNNKTLRLQIFNTIDTNYIDRRLNIWDVIDTVNIHGNNHIYYFNQNQASDFDRIIDYTIVKLTKHEFCFETENTDSTDSFHHNMITFNLKSDE